VRSLSSSLSLSPLKLTLSSCTGDYAVLLDKRTLKTPGGTQLLVPKERLPVALCIADEWENQTTVLKPHTLPMVRSTSSTSVEQNARTLTSALARRPRSLRARSTASTRPRLARTSLRTSSATSTPTLSGASAFTHELSPRRGTADALLVPARSFHETFPERLTRLQDAHWKPLIAWVEERYGVEVKLYEGILGNKQSDATVLKLGAVASEFDHFKLAGALPLSSLCSALSSSR